MAGPAQLLIEVLADVSKAESAFASFGGNIGKILGIGAGGAALAAATAVTTKAAIDQQSAMAKIQASYNDVDFQPGTEAYKTAVDQIVNQSQTLATSFDDVAAVHNQAARFIDDFGKRLSPEQVEEYTSSVLKLSKVSLDNLSPEDIERKIATFEKLSNNTNFGPVSNAVAASTSIHSAGEGPMLDSAIAILQSGGPLGVNQGQALGLANYLTDLGQGGQRGGTSLGRILMRQDSAARDELDPEVSAGKAKRARDAQEHIDDLQTSLKQAEAQQAQMYGQHGLKTQYRKNPVAMMESEDRIAKLNREIADSKADQLTDASLEANKRGQYSVRAMAKTAGMDPQAYAQLSRDNPVEALLSFTRGLHDMPATERAAAIEAAGINESKDRQTIGLLQDRPDVIAEQIATAQDQLDHPTALNPMAQTVLDTTASKSADVVNMQQNNNARMGEPARQGLDAFDDWILKIGHDAADQSTPVGQLAAGLSGLGGVVGAIAPFVLPYVAMRGLGARGAGAAAGAAGAAAEGGTSGTASLVAGAGGLLAGGLGAAAAGGVAYLQINQMSQSLDALNNARQQQGLAPINVNIGDIVSQGGSPDEVLQHVIDQVTAAWHTAMSTTPVSGAVGGNIGGQSPN